MRSGSLVALGTALLLAPVAIGLGATAVAAGIVAGRPERGARPGRHCPERPGDDPSERPPGVRPRSSRAGSCTSARCSPITGDLPAAALFVATGAAQLAVGGVTRYTASPAS